MNFFFDRCVSVRIARMLGAYERDHQIIHQDDDARFTTETTDVELITAIADDPKPVFITADISQRREPLERKALRDSGLTIFFIRRGFHQLPFHQQAVKLLNLWREIVRLAERAKEPTAFEISPAARKVTDCGRRGTCSCAMYPFRGPWFTCQTHPRETCCPDMRS